MLRRWTSAEERGELHEGVPAITVLVDGGRTATIVNYSAPNGSTQAVFSASNDTLAARFQLVSGPHGATFPFQQQKIFLQSNRTKAEAIFDRTDRANTAIT